MMEAVDRFCTALTCMDGRFIEPVIDLTREHFGASWVDTITEPGPVGILSEHPDSLVAEQIYSRIELSMEKHGSNQISVAAHSDCAGHPRTDTEQLQDLRTSRDELRLRFPAADVVCIWVPADEPPLIID